MHLKTPARLKTTSKHESHELTRKFSSKEAEWVEKSSLKVWKGFQSKTGGVVGATRRWISHPLAILGAGRRGTGLAGVYRSLFWSFSSSSAVHLKRLSPALPSFLPAACLFRGRHIFIFSKKHGPPSTVPSVTSLSPDTSETRDTLSTFVLWNRPFATRRFPRKGINVGIRRRFSIIRRCFNF